MKSPSALILSHDSVGAALIGAAVEFAGLDAAFPADGERLRDALRRVRPVVVLADCDRDDASAEAFVGPAMMTGARVVVYCSAADARSIDRARTLAERYDLVFFSLPGDADALGTYLDVVLRAVQEPA